MSIADLRSCLKEFASKLHEASETPAGRFIPTRRISSTVKKLDKALADSRGTHECPYCNGRGCKVCGTGRVTKTLYDASPTELKE